MNYWIPLGVGLIAWLTILWIIWKARQEAGRLKK